MPNMFTGKGWPFPVRPSAHGKFFYVGGDEKIRQSVWIILSTAPGERLMRPDFGCRIHDLVFQPNSAAVRGLIREQVRDALIRYEPRIDLIEIRVEQSEEAENLLLIFIDYKVRSNNVFYNLVYPFFLNEGAK